jgi:Group 4 capsule polysaccharide lipoprotein gfcB, YjbF
MTIKHLLPLLVAGFLTACGSEPQENTVLGPYLQGLQNLGRSAPVSPSAEDIRDQITPEVRAELGGAPLMIAVLEKNNLASVLIEERRNRNLVTYFTPDGISLTLKDGVLVGTRGLGFDLMSADVADILPAIQRNGREVVRIHRYLDGEDQIVIQSFVCDFQGRREVTETCYGDGLKIENSYRINGAGKIIFSRQWIGVEQGYVRLEPAS